MSATGDRPGEAGATLLEMLVVVAILGLVAGLTAPNLSRSLDAVFLASADAVLADDLRLARADAIRQGHAVAVERFADGRGWVTDRGRTRLASGLSLDGDAEAITFQADGSSSGGRWRLAGGGRLRTVRVDPVTGVTLAEGRR